MSTPFELSVKGEITFPFTGQVQSSVSASVPPSSAGGRGAGAAGEAAGGDDGAAGPGGAADGSPPAGGDDSCASARSEYGTFSPRGSTLASGVLESGRASTIGLDEASGV